MREIGSIYQQKGGEKSPSGPGCFIKPPRQREIGGN